MKRLRMKSAMLSLATVAGLSSAVFAGEPSQPLDVLTVSKGTWVSTGYVPNHKHTKVEVKATSSIALEGVALFCANGYTGGTTNFFNVYYAHFDDDLTFENGAHPQCCPYGVKPPAVGTTFTIQYYQNTITVDGTPYTSAKPEFEDDSASGPLDLFCSVQNGGRTEFFEGSVNYVKIWEDDELKMDLVPATGLDGVATLYDKVSDRYLVVSPAVCSWTGAGDPDQKWSTVANWMPGLPTSGDTITFTNEAHDVCLDTDARVAGKSASFAKFYNNDPATTNTLTLTDAFYASNIEAEGSVIVKSTGGSGYLSGDSVQKATGGAQVTFHKVDFNDNAGHTFISSGAGSFMTVPCAWYDAANWNTNVSFEVYDEGQMSVSPVYVGKGWRNPLDKFTLKSVNGLLFMNNSNNKITKAIDIYCDGGYIDVTSLQPAQANVRSAITFVNGGMLRMRGETKLPGNVYAPTTLTLCDACELQAYDSKLGLNSGLTIKLAPTLDSSATSGLITTHQKPPEEEQKKGANITLASGVKFEIDCSAFANVYGTKTMMLIQQRQSESTVSYSIPTAANVNLTGEGADHCKATFTQVGKDLMLTITSSNMPEDTVAVIEGVAAFNSLQAAFDAAGADDVVTLVKNVTLGDAVVVTNSVAMNVGEYMVSCEGEVTAGALFCVKDGGNLAVTGSGTIAGGDNAAVYVTSGAFYVPNRSQVLFTAENNNAILFCNEGTMPEAKISAGRFASTSMAPILSINAEGLTALTGFLEGGSYNKQPEADLIATGYKAEEVGENQWEVVQDGPAICMVGERYFATLQKAYEVVENEGDIFIISNATVAALTMDRNIKFWIDLKGHTLTPEVENGTIFTVEAGTVYLYDNPDPDVSNGALKGGVVVNGGKVSITMQIDADPALTVNGGSVTAGCMMNGSVVVNGGSLTMNKNTTINAAGVAITANGGTVTISGGSYTGDESAFVAASSYAYKGVDNGSFSSEVPAKCLYGNRKMELQGDTWVPVLIVDESSMTYTWNDAATGAWTNKANWTATPVDTRCVGYPNGDKGTVVFPASMVAGDVVTLDASHTINRVNFQNTNPMAIILDNAKLTLPAGIAKDPRPFKPGETGSVDLTFKGNAQIEAKSGWNNGRMLIGDNYSTKLTFELPATALADNTAALYASGDDAPIQFSTNVSFVVDMTAMTLPETGCSVTNVLAWSADGIRCKEVQDLPPETPEEVAQALWRELLSHLTVIGCPAGLKYELVYVNRGLNFIVTRPQWGTMFFIK